MTTESSKQTARFEPGQVHVGRVLQLGVNLRLGCGTADGRPFVLLGIADEVGCMTLAEAERFVDVLREGIRRTRQRHAKVTASTAER